MSKKKKLPIRIFEKRKEVDERLTEGGGNSETPKWVLEGEELKNKAEILLKDLDNVYQKIGERIEKYNGTPTILKAKMIDNIIAKTHRKDIKKFFSSGVEQDQLIGITGEQELLFRIDNINQLLKIKKNLADIRRNEKIISGIDYIEEFNPSIKLDTMNLKENEKFILKFRLVDFNNFQLNERVFKVFSTLISEQGGIKLTKSIKYAENLTIHEVVTDSLEIIDIFKDFSPILSIEPMPMINFVVEDDFFSSDELNLNFPQPIKGNDYPVVGVLDTGIAPIYPLNEWTLNKRHTNYPTHCINPSHGTFVAGIINFGDILEGIDYTGTKCFKLFDAAVFPDKRYESISEAQLVDNIREAIENNSEIKIWNLSLGSNIEVSYGDFSDFGIGLDNIQDENDVLIIKSASNCANFINGNSVSRIAKGADSVRAITVGSIAHKKEPTDIANINHLSPFSRIGPGPAGIIKPELVHYGGNASVANGNAVPNGVTSLDITGSPKKSIGTSFSTPRITALTAELNHKLKEDFDPLLLKALLIHSSKYPLDVDLPINEKINQLGFGVPAKVDEILFNDDHEITLILRDTLNKGDFIEILDFPFPNLINDEGDYYGQIFLTLVNAPILGIGQGPEYCQSDLDVYFGTYDSKTLRDTTVRTVRNPIGRLGSQNLLAASSYSKKKDAEKKVFSQSEKMLVTYGDKFHPNKKYAIDISELTKGNKEKFIKAPKNWYLKIEGLYREFIETQAENERFGLSQDFCMVLTIRDPLKKHDVYDEVTSLLESNNFINRNIQLNTDININLDGE